MAADMKLALILEARAQQARGELGATKAAVEALGLSFTRTGANAAGSTTELQRLIDLSTRLASATGLSAAETLDYDRALVAVRARFNPLFAVSRRYEEELRDIAAAEEMGAISALEAAAARERAAAAMSPMATGMRTLGEQSGYARANLSTLSFQMQDVVMMAAMGQAPLATMLQQGPQIVGVFDQMRQSGQKIGPAILGSITSLINPMSLLTLGVIAGGAALVQWGMAAFGAGEEAQSAEERMDGFVSALSRVREQAAIGRASVSDLRREFGDFGEDMRQIATYAAAVAVDQAIAAFDSGALTLRAEIDAIMSELDRAAAQEADLRRGQALGIVDQLTEVTTNDVIALTRDVAAEAAESLGVTVDQVTALDNAFDALDGAQSLTEIRDRAAEALDLINSFSPDGIGLTPALGAAVAELEKLITAAARAAATAEGADDGEQERLAFEQAINDQVFARQSLIDDERNSQAAIRQELEAIRALQADDLAAAQAKLAELSAASEIQALTIRYGAESVQVQEAMAAQARATYESWVQGLAVSGDMKNQLMVAYDTAKLLEGAAISAPIAAGADEAARLVANLQAALGAISAISAAAVSAGISNVGQRARLEALQAGQSVADAAVTGRIAEERERLSGILATGDTNDRRTALNNLAALEAELREGVQISAAINDLEASLRETGGGAGAGGGGAAAEADAVEGLIGRLTEELELLRETDPVQREMLRHREALAAATDAERAEVRALIEERLAEAEALEEVQRQMSEVRDLGQSVIRGIVDDLRAGEDAGEILAGVLDRIADKLIDIGTNSLTDALFGTGQPTGGSGLIGGFLQGLLFPGSTKVKPNALGDVYDRPILFGMGGGGLGLMAEAGPEAIMPLSHAFGAGVGARIAGVETTLPLARLASGKLGVDLGSAASPFALGGAFGDLPTARAPASWWGAAAPAAADPGPATPAELHVHVDVRGARGNTEIETLVRQAVETGVRQAVSADNRAFSASVRKVVTDQRKR